MMMTMMTVRSREYESPKKIKLRLDIEISKRNASKTEISKNIIFENYTKVHIFGQFVFEYVKFEHCLLSKAFLADDEIEDDDDDDGKHSNLKS